MRNTASLYLTSDTKVNSRLEQLTNLSRKMGYLFLTKAQVWSRPSQPALATPAITNGVSFERTASLRAKSRALALSSASGLKIYHVEFCGMIYQKSRLPKHDCSAIVICYRSRSLHIQLTFVKHAYKLII